MARYTIALRGQHGSSQSDMVIEEEVVDLSRGEHISEIYLRNVNPKGQVPALTSPMLPTPLTDSLDITEYLCMHYPQLLPQPYKATIMDLLKRLHAIQPLSLSVDSKQAQSDGLMEVIQRLLARPTTSDEYKEALRFKGQYHEYTLAHALEEGPVKLAEEQARDFFRELQERRELYAKNSLWIFGDEIGATALDAHTIPFIARLLEANRSYLIPADLLDYAYRAMSMPEWESVMQGRPTMLV